MSKVACFDYCEKQFSLITVRLNNFICFPFSACKYLHRIESSRSFKALFSNIISSRPIFREPQKIISYIPLLPTPMDIVSWYKPRVCPSEISICRTQVFLAIPPWTAVRESRPGNLFEPLQVASFVI